MIDTLQAPAKKLHIVTWNFGPDGKVSIGEPDPALIDQWLKWAATVPEIPDNQTVHSLPVQIVQDDPCSERGWLDLARALESEAERRFCLMQALALNESNTTAREQLLRLGPGPAHAPFRELLILPRACGRRRRATAGLVHRLRVTLHRRIALIAIGYLAALTLAEVLTTLIEPRIGLTLYGILLLFLIAHTALTWDYPGYRLLFVLAFTPLIRLLSLFLPLAGLPQIYWYLVVSIPLFAAALIGLRTIRLSRRDIGLTLRKLPLQFLVALTGFTLGYVEYRILRPAALASHFELRDLWLPALILFVCTGFVEELLFRGMMQRVATEKLGTIGGILYMATLFAVLHVGYRSLSDVVFVFVVALFFGLVVAYTRSIIGVSLAHGLANVVLFLVMPFGVNPFDAVIQLSTVIGR